MPRERWDQLVRGEDCPLCRDLAGEAQPNEFHYPVTELRLSRLALASNQWVPGYCVLTCRLHVREPFELSLDDRARYFDDLMRAARAIDILFKPVKLNYQILGNVVPHLHTHIEPRYYGDPAPGRPIDTAEQVVHLSPDEYEQRARAIREALDAA
jgi:diadenosine tetraphosphate (Ap4A) HIT family hydrolase